MKNGGFNLHVDMNQVVTDLEIKFINEGENKDDVVNLSMMSPPT